MALLIAAATRDDAGAFDALDRMRAAVRLGSVSEAVGLAAEILASAAVDVKAAG